ncbi:hypothetical protein MA16_Dca026637 [Dendrobium catenatum]|uniref:Uncharacterized protein n=1 Tax=Dendrobium catenatum TaxID=906689 RepID=A0A2I0VFP3_9ASPA|nr:hypothetical protein MA16_Dca026637 [Dendrobium catenatum]
MKLDTPFFEGKLHIEDYLDGKARWNRYSIIWPYSKRLMSNMWLLDFMVVRMLGGSSCFSLDGEKAKEGYVAGRG